MVLNSFGSMVGYLCSYVCWGRKAEDTTRDDSMTPYEPYKEADDTGEDGGMTPEEVAAREACTLDGDLFLVKHLLILREQLTPFDINFSQLRRKLDFTSTRQALTRFFGSPGSTMRGVFRWSKDNALLELAKAGLPLVDEHLVDAKHDLEDALKKAKKKLERLVVDAAVAEARLSDLRAKSK